MVSRQDFACPFARKTGVEASSSAKLILTGRKLPIDVLRRKTTMDCMVPRFRGQSTTQLRTDRASHSVLSRRSWMESIAEIPQMMQ
jgi:hypothetical protein